LFKSWTERDCDKCSLASFDESRLVLSKIESPSCSKLSLWQETASKPVTDKEIRNSPNLPVDWSIKTKARFVLTAHLRAWLMTENIQVIMS